MRKTNEQKLKERIEIMLEAEQNYLNYIISLQAENKVLNERVTVRDKNVQDLQQQINSLNDKFESVFAPTTIREGVSSLNQILAGIDCKITQREVFKSFVSQVIGSVKFQNTQDKLDLEATKQEYIRNKNEYLNFAELLQAAL